MRAAFTFLLAWLLISSQAFAEQEPKDGAIEEWSPPEFWLQCEKENPRGIIRNHGSGLVSRCHMVSHLVRLTVCLQKDQMESLIAQVLEKEDIMGGIGVYQELVVLGQCMSVNQPYMVKSMSWQGAFYDAEHDGSLDWWLVELNDMNGLDLWGFWVTKRNEV